MNPLEIVDPLCWNPGVPEPGQVTVEIPGSIIRESLQGTPSPATPLPSLLRWVSSWKNRLLTSPGFVLLQTDAGLPDLKLRQLYSRVAHALGQLNPRYGDFFDVKDQGLDHTKDSIPVSKTRADTGFHTDSSALEYSPQVVGLLCLQPALSGGESLLANAADLYCWLQHHHRESLLPLARPVKRDIITPGTLQNTDEIEKNAFPVLQLDHKGLHFRYMRYWITTAYQKLGRSLPEGLQEAMDWIDRFLADRGHVFSTYLKRGEILLANNWHLCHSRTAFTDATDGSRPRTLVRTWIDNVVPAGPLPGARGIGGPLPTETVGMAGMGFFWPATSSHS